MSESCSFNEAPSPNGKPSDESLHTPEFDINSPLDQDSPQNILNILNDDCLQLVLLKLKNINDFWRAAQVCTRFQANAKTCIGFEKVPFGYRIKCKKRDDDFHSMDHDFVSFNSAEDFLSLFGPRIKSIQCDFKSRSIIYYIGPMDHEENLRLISQYCGQTLTELEISGLNYNSNLKLRSPFQALKKLKLVAVSFSNLNASLFFPELQSLEIASIQTQSVEWLKNPFPMLQHVKIGSVRKLTDDIFIEFQNRNPQLQSLHVSDWVGTSSLVWENIGDRLPNIVEFSSNRVRPNITYLSTLRHLRILQLDENMRDISSKSKSFFRSLVRNNQPIEELKIHGVDFELGRILQGLKTIKVLHIRNSLADVVANLVKHLPALEYLHLYDFIQCIRLITVKKILQNCEKIKKIDIEHVLLLDGTTDLAEHNEIVTLASGRVEFNFECVPYYEMEVTIEYENMLEKQFRCRNNEWVRFKHRKTSI